jgi:hypothetical protein
MGKKLVYRGRVEAVEEASHTAHKDPAYHRVIVKCPGHVSLNLCGKTVRIVCDQRHPVL